MSLWPVEQAQRIQDRLASNGKSVATFSTGFGPSGLPHIGTLAEILRTVWVGQAYADLTHNPFEILAFSDDMDGLRKVPDNVPDPESMLPYLNTPLFKIPDPWNDSASFSEHNIDQLRELVSFMNPNHDVHFKKASNCYQNSEFDNALMVMARKHDEIVSIILPTLGKDRGATYSPFLPIHPTTGKVVQAKILEVNTDDHLLTWEHNEERFTTSYLGGRCKAQWKADWALRWYALGVDFEMSGKDLIDSVKLSSKICKALGGTPPINMTYELFLDESGQKISKSKGNGFSMEDWLQYGSVESLAGFLFSKPQTAKKIYRSLVPKAMDEIASQAQHVDNPDYPAYYINKVPGMFTANSPVSHALLLNLINVSNTSDTTVLWNFLGNYLDNLEDFDEEITLQMKYAIRYYQDVIAQTKQTRVPNDVERPAFEDLVNVLETMEDGLSGEDYQFQVYEVGKRHAFTSPRLWFAGLYEVLLGQSEGPRFGHFIAAFGRQNSIDLLRKATNA